MSILNARICVIGSGASGIVTAHTLRQDGFTSVQILTKDRGPGGVWSAERLYPGLKLNNVHGEFRFSYLPMPPPIHAAATGGRLSGESMTAYLERFASEFVEDIIRYQIEVLNIRRDGKLWRIRIKDLRTLEETEEIYDKVVLCTGGCSLPSIPQALSSEAVGAACFKGPVIHSSQLAKEIQTVLEKGTKDSHIVVVGGGKSAQDISSWLASKGRKNVSVVCEKMDAFLASPTPLPDAIRKSRLFSILSPHMDLKTRLERFLHTTRMGGFLVRTIWRVISWSSVKGFFQHPEAMESNAISVPQFRAFNIPAKSPLRNTAPIFWSVCQDEGNGRPNDMGFHSMVNKKKVDLICPARVAKFGADGQSVMLDDGRRLPADVVILCTGFKSSWRPILHDETIVNVGLDRHAAPKMLDEWNYTSLTNPPRPHPDSHQKMSFIYRGLVPAKNIDRRDFVINGAVFSINNGYTLEVCAHWISSYLMGDPFLRLPSPEGALTASQRAAAWYRKRFPNILLWANESYCSALPFWAWPQAADEMLQDMGLRSMRSGGNWLTWPFKVISVDELATLGEERRAKRKQWS